MSLEPWREKKRAGMFRFIRRNLLPAVQLNVEREFPLMGGAGFRKLLLPLAKPQQKQEGVLRKNIWSPENVD